MAAGYIQVTPYVPGIGAHYLNIGRLTDGKFKPGEPEMLLYNGNEPTSELVGLSYGVLGDDPPEGFVGPNDVWHVHPSLCYPRRLRGRAPTTRRRRCAPRSAARRAAFGDQMDGAPVAGPRAGSRRGACSAARTLARNMVATSDVARGPGHA